MTKPPWERLSPRNRVFPVPLRWVSLSLLGAVGWLCFGGDSMTLRAARTRCHEIVTLLEPDTRLELRAGSRWTADGELQTGTRSDCSAAEAPVFAAALQAYSKVPHRLRGPELRIDAMAPGSGIPSLEFEAKTGAIVASGADLPQVAWLHEIGHHLARGPRPDSLVVGRLYAALDEGVADYFAAVVNGSPDPDTRADESGAGGEGSRHARKRQAAAAMGLFGRMSIATNAPLTMLLPPASRPIPHL